MAVVDLSRVKSVLVEIEALIQELDGLDLSDDKSWAEQGSGGKARDNLRQLRAQKSQELQLLATRFELAASLVRVEFWHFKGEIDPLNRRR